MHVIIVEPGIEYVVLLVGKQESLKFCPIDSEESSTERRDIGNSRDSQICI